MRSYKKPITFAEDGTGYGRCYSVDDSKIKNEFVLRTDDDFASGIIKSVE